MEKMNISLSIWPPTQRTRDAVINRLIETLTAPSILSKRYGSLPTEVASFAAKSIEEEAFVIASSTISVTNLNQQQQEEESSNKEDDGIEILQIYSKEISKRMLEVVKANAAVAVTSPVKMESNDSVGSTTTTAAVAGSDAAATETSEEISSNEPESS
ncbi:hypothetical protein AQUCO_08300014v1 [Aquilegia coerulea]|uniref:WPP domain-containing protein n=1 Tax=Aquilegia coerulea TaxID=218851 RepID=A0A2G5C8C2_AQUCA|nr:hypothetical protein AQUCO_08300014v1 [Aquilegia coerulea]